MDGRCWNKDVLGEFIKIYQDSPCLWKIKSKDYTNRNLRNDAYKKLVDFCVPIFPGANKDFVIKKIQSLRGSFRKELKKMNDSKRSGSSTEEVYTPSLWYQDQEKPTESLSNIDDGHSTDTDFNDGDDSNELSFYENSEPDNQIEMSPFVKPSTPKRKRGVKKSNIDQVQIEFMKVCTASLEANRTLSEYDAIGVTVGKKLQRMDSMQAIFAESLINSILRRGLTNSLTVDTDLCEVIRPTTTEFENI